MKEEITNAQLFRFCAGETTVKENDRIAAWLDENPEEHQQRLNDVHSMYLVSILCDESEAKLPTRRSAWATSFRRYAAGIAAALLVGFAGSYAFFAFRLNGWAQQQTVIEAPAGPACPDFTQRRFGGRSEFRKPAHLPFDFQWQGTPGQTRR